LAGINEEDVVYSGLVAYDKSSPDKLEHDIYRGIDSKQETFIHVSNYSRYVLELRLGSSDGEKVAVLSPGQRYKRLWLQPEPSGFPLLFFPTYIYLDPNSGEMNAFTDRENLTGQRFEPEAYGEQREIAFRGPAAGTPQYNVAFVSFQNDTNSLLNFMTAQGNYKRNDRGTLSTSPGRTDIYQIDAGDKGKIYTAAGVFADDSNFHSIGQLDVLPGHKYQLVVTSMNGRIQTAIVDEGLKTLSDNVRINLFGE
jgi:hypothetical protein